MALEAAAMAPAAPPAAVLSGEETRRLQDSVLNIVELLERSGIRLDAAADERDQSLVLKSLRRPRKKKIKAGK
ncbi:hypothetical protein [Streptosporangium sp. NBC_01469]|uniref:hypothetical protein n=1 Tax=Streptosporangium sp. NBC_01469 TaxID=2903898 RepID=UPI002E2BCA47|nr:hypothetical protein [Streptosporangium sp. NBC_01469]